MDRQPDFRRCISRAAIAALEEGWLEYWAFLDKGEPGKIPHSFIEVLKKQFPAKSSEAEVHMVHSKSATCLPNEFPAWIVTSVGVRIGVVVTECELPPESYTGPNRYPEHLSRIVEAQQCFNTMQIDASYLLIVLHGYRVRLSSDDEEIARTFHNQMFVDWATMQLQPENHPSESKQWEEAIRQFGFNKPYLPAASADFYHYVRDAHLAIVGLHC
jgi:hypothetical protein